MNYVDVLSVESIRICLTLVHSLWQMLLIGLAIGLLQFCWRQRSIQWDYRIHVIALLLGCLCVPTTFLLLRTPRLTQAPQLETLPTDSFADSVTAETISPLSSSPISATGEPSDGLATVATRAVVPPSAEFASPLQSTDDHRPTQRWTKLGNTFAPWLVMLYVGGVLVMLCRLAKGIRTAEKLRRSSRPVLNGPMVDAMSRLAKRWKMQVVPALATVDELVIPKLVGLLRPTILIPTSATAGLSPDQFLMIIAHELAHVRRHDIWINFLQRLAETALFFNPMIWLLSRRISSIREFCCDELACQSVAATEPGKTQVLYAQALLHVAEASQGAMNRQSRLMSLAADGSSPSELRRRILHLFGTPVTEPLAPPRSTLLLLLVVSIFVVAQVVSLSVAQNSDAQVPDANSNSSAENASQPTAADQVVKAARAKTFDLGNTQRIAFQQVQRHLTEPLVLEHAEGNLETLWKARAFQGGDASWDDGKLQTVIAWDGHRLVLQRLFNQQSEAPFRQVYYWNGEQGWIGETQPNEDLITKNIYRYDDINKMVGETLAHLFPQLEAAGSHLLWPGPQLEISEHRIDPKFARYKHVGKETIDGITCDVYEGPERRETIWIAQENQWVKAVCQNYNTGMTREETLIVSNKVARQTFASIAEFRRWHEKLSETEREQYSARWAALTWKASTPGNLTVFSDHREVAPGVFWPHQIDRVVMHKNFDTQDGYKLYLSKMTVKQLDPFDIVQLASGALPTPGVKVGDRRGEVTVEYEWSDDLTSDDVRRIREAKLAEKRAEEARIAQINDATIESVSDAIDILREGPSVTPTKIWARAIQYLTEHPEQATPALIAALDQEDRDHPISKLAYAIRAVGDRRAVPALIRAFPKTLLSSRGDYVLTLEDDELQRFMQQHDIGEMSGQWFSYSGAFREVVGALQRLTDQQFNEMEFHSVSVRCTARQQKLALQQFERVAKRWADWWEGNWQDYVEDPTYSKVNLEITTSDIAAVSADQRKIPRGADVEMTSVSSSYTLQSVHDAGKACFLDLDTLREADWPQHLPALGKTQLNSPDLLAWARQEGLDVVGITYTPNANEPPIYCLMPLDLKAWKISENEHRNLAPMLRGEQPYPLSKPVELLTSRREIPKPRDPEHSGDSYLYITREGSAGLVRITAQITKTGGPVGMTSSDAVFSSQDFHRGVRFEVSNIYKSTGAGE